MIPEDGEITEAQHICAAHSLGEWRCPRGLGDPVERCVEILSGKLCSGSWQSCLPSIHYHRNMPKDGVMLTLQSWGLPLALPVTVTEARRLLKDPGKVGTQMSRPRPDLLSGYLGALPTEKVLSQSVTWQPKRLPTLLVNSSVWAIASAFLLLSLKPRQHDTVQCQVPKCLSDTLRRPRLGTLKS